MKSLFSKFCYGLMAVLLCFAVCSYSATASTDHQHFKIEKVFKVANDVNAVFTVATVNLYAPGDLPVTYSVKLYEAKYYAVTANAPKPDNTLYQLIRAKQLKLHTATDSKAC